MTDDLKRINDAYARGITDAAKYLSQLAAITHNPNSEFTTIEPPAQKWTMPPWDELKLDANQVFSINSRAAISNASYNSLRDKIMAMNK